MIALAFALIKRFLLGSRNALPKRENGHPASDLEREQTLNRRDILFAGASLSAFSMAGVSVARERQIAREAMDPPEWARLQRQLLEVSADACEAFYGRYFDSRDHLEAVAHWGANDGPDDAIENVDNWPLLHALGASDRILELYKRAWEGHLAQYSAARTIQSPIARDGMYYREFTPAFDWLHITQALCVFNLQGLSDPRDQRLRERTQRFAGLYLNEDPSAPNYDPERRLIRSMFNGSRGPVLRKATPLDWTGDPFDVSRFKMEHREKTFADALRHYADYSDIIGDTPMNLLATTLGLNAYMLIGQRRYRAWVLDYVDAWIERADANGGLIPSNVGLDGTIGGAVAGKWYGGAFGWGFSPLSPVTGAPEHSNRTPRCFVGFMNAYLLSGDDKYLDVWRRQADVINAQRRIVDGKAMTPRMFGDEGWYGFAEGDYAFNSLEIWYLSQKASDRTRAPNHPWLDYLEGRRPDFPVASLEAGLARVQSRLDAMASDDSSPATRLADNALDLNPATVTALIQLTQGGLHIGRPPWAPSSPNVGGAPLHCRLRYFDPVAGRAGLPPDVAALVESMTDDEVVVTLVNLNAGEARVVTLQGGAYGEHQLVSVSIEGRSSILNAPYFELELAPGCGGQMRIGMRRFVNLPTLAFPWDRSPHARPV